MKKKIVNGFMILGAFLMLIGFSLKGFDLLLYGQISQIAATLLICFSAFGYLFVEEPNKEGAKG